MWAQITYYLQKNTNRGRDSHLNNELFQQVQCATVLCLHMDITSQGVYNWLILGKYRIKVVKFLKTGKSNREVQKHFKKDTNDKIDL